MNANLYLAPRTPNKYPLLDLLRPDYTAENPFCTPQRPPPEHNGWAPPRRRLGRQRNASGSESDLSSLQTLRSGCGRNSGEWTVVSGPSSVTLTAATSTGTAVTVTLHL
ncbi:E4 [Colobus guereza papillomavirus 1]|uniref:E4 n=1 Tax=Colobus guereza papillomavirus 1 TaxID=2759889 RepID=F8QPQ4_9PAPI|nr:E4 [Colobus guereza papillomavirus 1]